MFGWVLNTPLAVYLLIKMSRGNPRTRTLKVVNKIKQNETTGSSFRNEVKSYLSCNSIIKNLF